jgi:uncharacterized protein with NRDE domain
MCILFVFIKNDAAEDEFSVIVAKNRDEIFHRPATPAHFWNEDCIGGTVYLNKMNNSMLYFWL